MHWLSRAWWTYLLRAPDETRYTSDSVLVHYARTVACRLRGHEGPIWYRSQGDEPDMRCRHCGDDLG